MQEQLNVKRGILHKKVIIKHVIFFASAGGFIAFLTLTGIGCPLKRITGIPCPTCGLTRSVLALLRLDFKASFDYFPLTIPLLPALGIALHLDVIKRFKKFCLAFVITTAVLVVANYALNLNGIVLLNIIL